MGVAIGRCLESEADLLSIQSLSQNFRAHNTCSDGLTGTAANRLEPGYFSRGGKSVVILPNHDNGTCIWITTHRRTLPTLHQSPQALDLLAAIGGGQSLFRVD